MGHNYEAFHEGKMHLILAVFPMLTLEALAINQSLKVRVHRKVEV